MCSGRVFFFQAEGGIRDLVRSRGLGDVYKRQVDLSRATLSDAKLASATLKNCDCSEATLADVSFARAIFEDVDASGATLTDANLTGCRLMDVDLSGCCLLYTSPSPRDRTRSRMPSSA